MKNKLMELVLFLLAVAVMLWSLSGDQNQVSVGDSAVGVSTGAPIALMDQGLAPNTIDYYKIEPDSVEGGKIETGDDELEEIVITAPRYRPEKEEGRIELLRKTPSVGETELGFLGEYRATIRCGKKCREAAAKKR